MTAGDDGQADCGRGRRALALTDPERLDVCRVALEFQVLASTLVLNGYGALRDQLERAPVSGVLLIALRARMVAADKRHF